MAKGYYSVIQYNPDPSRAEAANVGVALLVPGAERPLWTLKSDRLSRVKTFFKPDKERLWRVRDALRSNIARLTREPLEYATLEGFEHFVKTLANDIKMTMPRVVVVDNAVEDVRRLFEELVEREAHSDASQALTRNASELSTLDGVFVRLLRANRAWHPGKVSVPVLNRKLDVPYAYQNGVTNLVKPFVFPSGKRAETQAANLAVNGDLIRRHPIDGKQRQLIVVSTVEDAAIAREVSEHVAPLFEEYDVRLIRPADVEAFAKEVEASAH